MADRTIVSLAIGGSMEDHHEGTPSPTTPRVEALLSGLNAPEPISPDHSSPH
jgi:hypothetical protein